MTRTRSDGPEAALRSLARIGAAARNGLEILRFGGLRTGDEPAPYDVVAHHRMYRLRRYFAPEDPAATPRGAPVLLVPPLMLSANVYDVAPTSSAVTALHEHGIDPWVIDFGAPEREEGGLERTLADHVLAVSRAVDEVRAGLGRDVHLAGYCQGGVFGYQAAAYRRGEGVASIVTFGSPVDLRGALPLGIPEWVANAAAFLADHVLARRGLPAWAGRIGFQLLDPTRSVRRRLQFLLALHDRQALLRREGQRRFLGRDGWVGYPGPALVELLKQYVAHNQMASGGVTIDGRLATFADLRCPVLCFSGEIDKIARPASVRAVSRAMPLARVYEVSVRAGHMGLVVGSTAQARTWPMVADWVRWQEGAGQRPSDTSTAQPSTGVAANSRGAAAVLAPSTAMAAA